MEKKRYETAEIEIVFVEEKEIIRTSNGWGDDNMEPTKSMMLDEANSKIFP